VPGAQRLSGRVRGIAAAEAELVPSPNNAIAASPPARQLTETQSIYLSVYQSIHLFSVRFLINLHSAQDESASSINQDTQMITTTAIKITAQTFTTLYNMLEQRNTHH